MAKNWQRSASALSLSYAYEFRRAPEANRQAAKSAKDLDSFLGGLGVLAVFLSGVRAAEFAHVSWTQDTTEYATIDPRAHRDDAGIRLACPC